MFRGYFEILSLIVRRLNPTPTPHLDDEIIRSSPKLPDRGGARNFFSSVTINYKINCYKKNERRL